MKDLVLYIRLCDLKHMCEALAKEGHPESSRLNGAAQAFAQIITSVEKRLQKEEKHDKR